MSTTRVQELKEDIQQLKQFLLASKRPNNQTALSNILSALKTELQVLTPKKIQPLPQEKIPNKQNKSVNINYIPLTKYAFDQQGNKIKIYFTLDNVGQQCTADQVDIVFEKQSVSMKLHNYKKANYIFAVKKLNGPIDPQYCKYLIKTNSVCLVLSKKDKKHWGQLNWKEDTFKEEKQKDLTTSDPNESLMNLMKKMYTDGDENMKRTIAEAWSKSNNNKGQPPSMPGFGGDKAKQRFEDLQKLKGKGF